jgi:hypothetical protein
MKARTTRSKMTNSQTSRSAMNQPRNILLAVCLTAAIEVPSAVIWHRAISAASPYPHGCGIDMSQTGFGDGFSNAYDVRRDTLGDRAYTSDVWFAHSRDGGATWRETHIAGPFDLRSAPLRRIPVRGHFVGDYHGLVPLHSGFGAAFAMAKPKARLGATEIFFAHLLTSP